MFFIWLYTAVYFLVNRNNKRDNSNNSIRAERQNEHYKRSILIVSLNQFAWKE